jgi:hypothetical protein
VKLLGCSGWSGAASAILERVGHVFQKKSRKNNTATYLVIRKKILWEKNGQPVIINDLYNSISLASFLICSAVGSLSALAIAD